MLIRIATSADVSPLADLFIDSVEKIGPQHYNALQIEAWSALAKDPPAFRQFILEPMTYLIEDDSGIVGFGGLADEGHLVSLYVRGDRCRQGIGTILLEALLEHARRQQIDRLYAEANEFSRPLLARAGFRQHGTEVIERGEACFTRYLMQRDSDSKASKTNDDD